MSARGEWIEGKARGLLGMIPGTWQDVGGGVLQGRCPAEGRHSGGSAETDARVHLSYGAGGQPPGVYCLHHSCKTELDEINARFREAIFAKDPNFKPSAGKAAEEGVVRRAPWGREAWIPEFSISKLRGVVKGVEVVTPEWFEERSPVRVKGLTPGEFIEHVFEPGERCLVFTEFKSQGDYLWEVGRGGFRLGDRQGVQAVRSKLPRDGGKDGIWYLCNPVDGQWHANPRRAGRFSRRSEEAVRGWKHMVLECDEAKTLKKRAGLLRDALATGKAEDEMRAALEETGGKKWVETLPDAAGWEAMIPRMEADALAVPGLWMRLLAMMPLAIRAIYSSGGDSWHALVVVNMQTKADFDTYLRNSAKRTLPIVGADPGAMTPVRLTRLPGCTRNGREQRLIYLNPNPSPEGVPIRDMPRLRKLT